jgi:predicted O-methyltransferase YrrM
MLTLISKAYYGAWRNFYAPKTKDLEGFLTIKEGKELFSLARKLPYGSSILEVGSFKGLSTNYLLLGMHSRSRIFCIDSWLEPVAGQPSVDNFNIFLKNTQVFSAFLTIVRGRSENRSVVQQIPSDIALLFIDAGHAFDDVVKDLTNYLPKVLPGGIVAMHDYYNPCEVKQATDLFIQDGSLYFLRRVGSMAICSKR